MLCEKCFKIHFKPASEYGLADESSEGAEGILIVHVYYFHHANKVALSRSAHDGCHFCVMIWRALFRSATVKRGKPWSPAGNRVYFKSTYRYLLPGHTKPGWEQQDPCSRLEFIIVACEDRMDMSSAHYRRCQDPFNLMLAGLSLDPNKSASNQAIDAIPSILTDSRIFSPELDNSTTSEANILLARTWLDTCLNGHQPCGIHALESVFPRRVINISNPTWPWLQDGKAIGAQYVALSYKWGNCDKYTTTTRNYHRHKTAIPLQKLPKTFREAIRVAHDLGFHYLWIDAICIIQDLKEDLESQIASMDQVYQNATLALFAASGNDADSGLSLMRDPRITKPCRIPIRLTVYEEAFHDLFFIVFNITADHGYNSYPLFGRGWVLQEQVLSRRCLIFGDDLMSWSCLCSASSESFPNISTTVSTIQEMVKTSSSIFKHPDLVPGFKVLTLWLADQNPLPDRLPSRRNNHFDEWYKMVSKYSTYALTNPVDVLPAVQGVANAMAKMHRSTYNSGLWMEDLDVGLAWRVTKASKDKSPSKRPNAVEQKSNSIPSWSWASQWGYHIRFLEWEANEELYSWEGLVSEESEGNDLVVYGRARDAEVYPSLKKKKRRSLWLGSVFDPDSTEEIGEIAYDADPDTTDVTLITCLLCTVQKKNDFKLTCLALVPTENMSNEYRRVGLVFLSNKKWLGHIDRGYRSSTSRGYKDFQKYCRKLKIV